MHKNKFIVSNGFNKYPLSDAATEFDKSASLKFFITGAYPLNILKKIIKFFSLNKLNFINRFFLRSVNIKDELVYSLFISDFIFFFGIFVKSKIENYFYFLKKLNFSEKILEYSSIRYQKKASKILKSNSLEINDVDVFFFRSGFGGESLITAKNLGLKTVCYQGGAHPKLEQYIIKNRGRLPTPDNFSEITSDIAKQVVLDLKNSDYIIAEGHWSKKTIIQSGIKENKVFEIIRGCSNQFMEILNKNKGAVTREKFEKSRKFKFLYVGALTQRKGIDILMDIFDKLDDTRIELTVGGEGLDREFLNRFNNFKNKKNVNYLGLLSYEKLAFEMLRNDIFIFPSTSEGVARVVNEACAAGMYPIISKNVGSFIKDNINGSLLDPSDIDAWVETIKDLINNPKKIEDASKINIDLSINKFNQDYYGKELLRIFSNLN